MLSYGVDVVLMNILCIVLITYDDCLFLYPVFYVFNYCIFLLYHDFVCVKFSIILFMQIYCCFVINNC